LRTGRRSAALPKSGGRAEARLTGSGDETRGKIAFACAALAVTAAAVASETITYTHDARGWLVKVGRSGTVNEEVKAEYKYDKGDNRTNVNIVSPN
jgi:hypothetical protein